MMCFIPLFGVLLASTSHAAYEEAVESRPCLDYWSVGNSKGCEKPKDKKKKPPQPTPPSPTVPPVQAAPNTPPSSTLDVKIDKFLADHGKPPREFVAFYLDPTPEHAVQWVAKYNELLQRGQDIAVAWTQAETLYNDAVKAGVSPTALNPTAYPVVPDFGIPVPGFNTPAFTQLISSTIPVVQADLTGSAFVQQTTGVLPPPGMTEEEGLLKPQTPATVPYSGKPLEVSYYFSAVCPYCQKFEPDFRDVLRDMGDKVNLTCVDVTPETGGHSRTPENVNNLPCIWRAATPDELTRLGVKQTPSLIIDKGESKPLELISGYVEPGQLLSYFMNMLR